VRWCALAVALSVVAGASIGLAPSGLGYDPWAWLVWGGDLAGLDPTSTGGPSWKPLPVLVTTAFSPLGDLAPTAWLFVVRLGALVSLLLSYRVGYRLGGRIAGAIAAATLLLGADLARSALHGYSESILIALVLGAIDRHLSGQRGFAFALGAMAALGRPELWPFLLLYGVLAWRSSERNRPVIVGAAIALPLLWIGLDLAGSGELFHAGEVAKTSAGGLAVQAHSPSLEVFRGAARLATLPVILAALAAGLLARPGAASSQPVVFALALLCAVWICGLAGLAAVGFPYDSYSRLLAVPVAVSCLLAGVGAAWLVQLGPSTRTQSAAFLALAVVFGAFALAPARKTVRLLAPARDQRDHLEDLRSAVRATGGARVVLAAGRPAVNPYFQTALAWELGVKLDRVQPTWNSNARHPGWEPPAFVFRGDPAITGPRPSVEGEAGCLRRVVRVGSWEVLRCSGGSRQQAPSLNGPPDLPASRNKGRVTRRP
jgi:hypothetical protein